MAKKSMKVIFVITNYGEKLGDDDGTKTGWYLPEVAHPHSVLTKAGFEIVYVSPKGGHCPMDVGSGKAFEKDLICQEFLKNQITHLDKTLKAADLTPSDYAGLFFAGGHGPMFDLPGATDIATLAQKIYENKSNKGVLGSVCHGVAGFVPIKLSNGDALVKGKNVTCFTNAEETAVGMCEKMPFLLETKLKELGGNFVAVKDWGENVQVADRVVSGQNPASATAVGNEMAKLMLVK